MKNKRNLILILSLTLVVVCVGGVYSEQVQRDMSASVVVLPIFKLSIDNANISFGYVEPGKTVELYPSRNYNEVKCSTNKGNKWYLKLSIIGEVIRPEGSTVGPDSFKWMVDNSSGDGVAEADWHSFTDTPARAYTSSGRDETGEEVTVRLKYKLDLPGNAVGGNYSVKVLYTMTDIP